MGTAVEWTRRTWRRFGHWRRGRPFAAGLALLPASAVIAIPPYASFRMGDVAVTIATIGGVSALLIGALLAICGLSLWLRPQFRFAAGTTALLLSLIALTTTNLGGFLVGTLLGVTGSALALAWTDQPRPPRPPREARWAVFRRGSVVFVVLAVAVHTAPLASSDVTPARSWTLLADRLSMDGVIYHGIEPIVVDGRPMRTMRFTVEEMRITRPVLIGVLGNGRDLVITTRHEGGAAATGGIELFVLRLAGDLNLLDLVKVPVDFTPDRPPPLVPPSVVLTDVTTVNAQLRGGTLAMKNAQLVLG
ncbi:hypothetical protein FHS29_003767 [Saccharothrix tamanrassetensis]|uniref:Uncharacterized protein n=1 Tax=Saccharothrix tamanrassetensis TaxID=1051531 RepID=A0A841CLD0_9PSEU|nr:DUF6114 domain-containing protein [Saccharothrix tamanrassetensis]MBB5957174.1 hypothetical protein [Saccharothrix tamanrassetensis]